MEDKTITRDIIIDTDGGVDDAMAILLALRSHELNVKAITTVCGNVPVHQATENVLRTIEVNNLAWKKSQSSDYGKSLETNSRFY
jgi:inosine-uridine nucleoside N-ribohydrolase